MAKMITRARQLRLDLASKRGEPISIRRVAREMGVDHRRLMKLENNGFEEPDFSFIAQVAEYYHRQGVDARGIVEFDPNAIRTPGPVALSMS
jgi:transcriptional regulator with XRE-family HTH domain